MSFPFEDMLIGHVNPLPSYPALVIPIIAREMRPYVPVGGTELVEPFVGDTPIWHNFDATVVIAGDEVGFDFRTHRLLAMHERLLVAYHPADEAALFGHIVASPALRPDDPFVTFAFAKLSLDEDLIQTAAGKCLKSLETTPALRERWYDEQQRLVAEGTAVTLPNFQVALRKFVHDWPLLSGELGAFPGLELLLMDSGILGRCFMSIGRLSNTATPSEPDSEGYFTVRLDPLVAERHGRTLLAPLLSSRFLTVPAGAAKVFFTQDDEKTGAFPGILVHRTDTVSSTSQKSEGNKPRITKR